ncbi:unnamed protein product, partial [Ilex paraguariensis]
KGPRCKKKNIVATLQASRSPCIIRMLGLASTQDSKKKIVEYEWKNTIWMAEIGVWMVEADNGETDISACLSL